MDLSVITFRHITCVAELIDISEDLEEQIKSGERRWAYRGQSQEFGTLVPSFQRQFSRQSIGTAELIEQKLMQAFREHYMSLGDRSKEMPLPDQIGEKRDLRCLSVMQHYEIPTRLLDWSSDFWTSVYFACSTDPSQNAEFWMYDQKLFDYQRLMYPDFSALLDKSENPPDEPPILNRRGENFLVELDPQISPRMKRQFGHHTVATNAFSDHAPLLHSMQLEQEPQNPNALKRIIISNSCKSKALQFLAEYKGITASTIFPDVVGLGRFLRWQFESLRTMLL